MLLLKYGMKFCTWNKSGILKGENKNSLDSFFFVACKALKSEFLNVYYLVVPLRE